MISYFRMCVFEVTKVMKYGVIKCKTDAAIVAFPNVKKWFRVKLNVLIS